MFSDELNQRLLTWVQDNQVALSIAAALVVGFLIGRYRAYRIFRYQNAGEARVARVLKASFLSPDYHLMNHVTLPMNDGTTQVDHILISRFGVFVIETKNYKGWIFGDARYRYWTQILFHFRSKFQNPIFQNQRHVRAVQSLLDFVPSGAITPIVVFTGDAEFKTQVPQGVVNISGLVAFIRDRTVEVMSVKRVQFCVGRLESARLALSRKTDVEHVQSLERRHGSAV